MPVLSEDTFALLSYIEQNEALYGDCYRITTQALERHPPRGRLSDGISKIAKAARSELSVTLRNVIDYCDDTQVQDYLSSGAIIDWHDVAREFIADVLCREDE